MLLSRQWKIGLLLLSIPLAALGGYWVMRSLTTWSSLSQDIGAEHYVVTLAIIVLGLVIPYWILKAGAWAAHIKNWREKKLRLQDIPKDKEELQKDQTSN